MLIWIDIDNAPHVLVMRPLIDWLVQKGCQIEVTARDYGQTLPLLELFGIPHTVIGKHAGKRMYRKVISFFSRSVSLFLFARKREIATVFCHGTRGVFIPARLLGIPLIVMTDYEHASLPGFMRRWVRMLIIPEVIPEEAFGPKKSPVRETCKYPGLKEELYVYDCDPKPEVMEAIGIDLKKPVVLIRPPASMAHYHVADGDRLFTDVLQYFRRKPEIQVVLLPRTQDQAADCREYLRGQNAQNIRIPEKVTYGPDMIYYSDLVISGGGTMNREAACMGIPVLSIFRGPLGSVDRHLVQEGKLRILQEARQLDAMSYKKVPKPDLRKNRSIRKELVDYIGNSILSVVSRRPVR